MGQIAARGCSTGTILKPNTPYQNIEYISENKDSACNLYSSFIRYKKHTLIGVVASERLNNELFEFPINRDPFYRVFKNWIYNMPFPERWEKEGIIMPNLVSKEKTEEVCCSLYDDYKLIPSRIAPTKEEGIAAFYKIFNGHSMVIEVYNDLEIAAIINDDVNKKIISSAKIKELNFSSMVEILFS